MAQRGSCRQQQRRKDIQYGVMIAFPLCLCVRYLQRNRITMPSTENNSPTIWTVGHSTRPIEELLKLLHAAGIKLLADVRRFPGSRRHPQFNQDALAASLAKAAVKYRHFVDLG